MPKYSNDNANRPSIVLNECADEHDIMRDVAGVEMTIKFPSRGPHVRLMGALRRPADEALVRAMISAEMHALGDRIFAEWQRRTGKS